MDDLSEKQTSESPAPLDPIPSDLKDQPSDDTTIKSAKAAIRLKLLKLYYYRELVKTVAVFVQTFKVEAVSLMAGISTMVLGWIQIKKWVVQSRQEIKALSVEGTQAVGKGSARVGHKVKEASSNTSVGSGGGSGGGAGYSGSKRVATEVFKDAPIEMVATMGAVEKNVDTFASDPGFYGVILTAVVFVFTLIKSVKRRFGGSNGSV